jgi:hypothetical protein
MVIIGPDLTGNKEYIGSYGQIIQSHYELQPNHAFVLMWAYESKTNNAAY